MKRLLLILAALPALAQQSVEYVASSGNVSLSAAATAVTLQQPANVNRGDSYPVVFTRTPTGTGSPVAATIYCSAACVATVSRNCTTAATATTGTVTPVLPSQPAAAVTLWTASNASGCTALRVINVGAGQEYALSLGSFSLGTGGTIQNLHIAIASTTATVNITFYPVEQR